MKEYEIDGKTYVQKTLVLGQLRQLVTVLDGVKMPEQLTLVSLLDALGERLYSAIAVAITEKGCSPRDKTSEELAALGEKLEWFVDADVIMEIVSDFFELNPVSSLLRKIGILVGGLNRALVVFQNGSTRRSSSSPAGTSPEGTASSGDTP